jgi:hypothetical protein
LDRLVGKSILTVVVKIADKHEIVVDESDTLPITDMTRLLDDLSETTPRYILLSYPLVLEDGRKTTPFVMIYYRPKTATQESRMIYAGATELVRNEAGVAKYVDQIFFLVRVS